MVSIPIWRQYTKAPYPKKALHNCPHGAGVTMRLSI